jgi:hypothetical protein
VGRNSEQPGWPQITIRRMRIACSVARVTETHTKYVIPNAFPLQQWLNERDSMYMACLVVPGNFKDRQTENKERMKCKRTEISTDHISSKCC